MPAAVQRNRECRRGLGRIIEGTVARRLGSGATAPHGMRDLLLWARICGVRSGSQLSTIRLVCAARLRRPRSNPCASPVLARVPEVELLTVRASKRGGAGWRNVPLWPSSMMQNLSMARFILSHNLGPWCCRAGACCSAASTGPLPSREVCSWQPARTSTMGIRRRVGTQFDIRRSAVVLRILSNGAPSACRAISANPTLSHGARPGNSALPSGRPSCEQANRN